MDNEKDLTISHSFSSESCQDPKKETEEPDELTEEDVPAMIYWLLESYNCLDAMDPALMGRRKQKQLEDWKEKLWDSLDNYIKILPTG